MSMSSESSHTEEKLRIPPKYSFEVLKEEDYCAIRIREGAYDKVLVKYGMVSFGTEESDGQMPMKFEYVLLENPNNVEDGTPEMISVLGDILLELLEQNSEQKKE